MEAAKLLRRALQILELQEDVNPFERAMVQANLANSLKLQGQLDEAEQLYRSSLTTLERQLGPDHIHVGVLLAGLAYILWQRGNLVEADRLYARAINIHKREGFLNHPSTQPMQEEHSQLRKQLRQ
jgi:tetratricopeptide (TPR) repeat protein